MGRYTKNKKKKNSRPMLIAAVCVLAVVLAAMIWVAVSMSQDKDPVQETPGMDEYHDPIPVETTQPKTEQTQPMVQTQETHPLEQGLVITDMSNYAGIYMEDGSDEIVSGVMMVILENTSELDLQLARIEVVYEDFTAAFEVTNLPAGQSVVLLEKSRSSMPGEDHQRIDIKNVVFFDEPMTMMEDVLEISGGDGYLDVKNISGETLTGEIFIYYKNSARDLLYGGITYRARIENGIGAGETIRILTGHYTEGNSRILHVLCDE